VVITNLSKIIKIIIIIIFNHFLTHFKQCLKASNVLKIRLLTSLANKYNFWKLALKVIELD